MRNTQVDAGTRCRLWERLFYRGLFEVGQFDEAEYAALGCTAFPVAQLGAR